MPLSGAGIGKAGHLVNHHPKALGISVAFGELWRDPWLQHLPVQRHEFLGQFSQNLTLFGVFTLGSIAPHHVVRRDRFHDSHFSLNSLWHNKFGCVASERETVVGILRGNVGSRTEPTDERRSHLFKPT